MKGILLIIIYVFGTLKLLAQDSEYKGRVTSSDYPVEYATISSKNSLHGIYTDDHGNFFWRLADTVSIDSICISALGFKPKTISFLEFIQRNEFELDIDTTFVPPVEITAPRLKSMELGTSLRKPEVLSLFSRKTWYRRIGRVLRTNGNQNGYLENIQVYLGKSGISTTPFRVRFYEMITTNTGYYPHNEIIRESIIGRGTKKGKWTTIQLEDYNIPISDRGVLISLEWIYNDSDEFSYQIPAKDKRGSFIRGWGGSWGCEIVENENGTWVTNSDNMWIYRIVENSRVTNAQPMIKARIKY